MAAMTLCVGCSSAKDGSKDTTKATTETKMKVQSKYKVPKITAAMIATIIGTSDCSSNAPAMVS